MKIISPHCFQYCGFELRKKISGKRQIKIDKVQKVEDESMIHYEIFLYVCTYIQLYINLLTFKTFLQYYENFPFVKKKRKNLITL